MLTPASTGCFALKDALALEVFLAVGADFKLTVSSTTRHENKNH